MASRQASSCLLYSWMRLICITNMAPGSTAVPVSSRRTLASALLVVLLDAGERVQQLRVVGRSGDLGLQRRSSIEPAFAEAVAEQAGEGRVRVEEPSPGRDAVGLVVELLRLHLEEIRQELALDELRVETSHAVDAVRPHRGEVGHAHLLNGALLDDGHAREAGRVAGPPRAHFAEEPVVDLEDDHQVPRQHAPQHGHGPLLERLGHQRVVRVRDRPLRDVPGGVPVESLLVDQHSHQLRDGDGRVRVVELDGECAPGRGESRSAAACTGRTTSAMEQATKKYCCLRRSSLPSSVWSLG